MKQTSQYKRKIYLEDKPREKALKEILAAFEFERVEEAVETTEALGRITAKPIYAKLSAPHYHASAMDGIAVSAENTYGAHEKNPRQLSIENGDFIYVDTGHPIPSPYNAVIMIEHVDVIDEDRIEIIEPASPWQHIRPVGEDVISGEMILPQGHKLTPVDLGALLAGGVFQVPVVKKPEVSIIPTGNEIVSPSLHVKPGQIIETNGTVFANYVKQWGGQPSMHPIVPDEPEKIRNALLSACESSDIVIINAGSSAGSRDYTAHIIEELGELYSHGVATRPGKPVVLGKINKTVVIGLPGYPVSAYLSMEWFVMPLIYEYLGTTPPKRETVEVKLGRRIVSNMGSEDFIRMNIGYVNGEYIANPLTRAAGVTMSMVRADGLLKVPADSLGIEQGEKVEMEMYKPIDTIKKSILFSGSHDLTVDVISSFIRRKDSNRQVVSSHTGSMAGIMAIKKGETHVAGIHLLDPETGLYNTPFIEKYLSGQSLVLLPFLKRVQGWIVPKGNPYQVETIDDIQSNGLHFVNRQKGAGTRILFDTLLKKGDLDSSQITGYEREMFSHLSVAAEVKQSESSVGLGIYSAAKEMGLDFIPVADESYDLLMTKDFYESEGGQLLFEVLTSAAFQSEVTALGGYKVEDDLKPISFS
jgi:putative molybdopterin biosynthesis protein